MRTLIIIAISLLFVSCHCTKSNQQHEINSIDVKYSYRDSILCNYEIDFDTLYVTDTLVANKLRKQSDISVRKIKIVNGRINSQSANVKVIHSDSIDNRVFTQKQSVQFDNRNWLLLIIFFLVVTFVFVFFVRSSR